MHYLRNKSFAILK